MFEAKEKAALIEQESCEAGRSIISNVLDDGSLSEKFSDIPEDWFLDGFQRQSWRGVKILDAANEPINAVTLTDAISSNGDRTPTLVKLLDYERGAVACGQLTVDKLTRAYVKKRLDVAGELIQTRVADGDDPGDIAKDAEERLSELRAVGRPKASGNGQIRRFEDIPDILTRKLPDIDLIVPALGIAANTVGVWTGGDGLGKTYLAQAMALAVARGETFLGMKCRPRPVLYIDLENPGFMVQSRLRILTGDDEPQPMPLLKIWGEWDADVSVPHAASELLLNICKETKPLLIIDPFLYFHSAKENDASEMAGVMQYLRACAAYGCGVVLLHHPSKVEGSTGRGSSAIRGACDFAFLHSLDKESGIVTLRVDKNRNGATPTFTIRADFEEGKFDLIDSPFITRRNDEMDKLEQIITDNPGISQNAIVKQSGGMKARVGKLLKEGAGSQWMVKPGSNNSKNYYPCQVVPFFSEPLRTTEPLNEQVVGGSGGSPLKGGEPPNHSTKIPCSGGSSWPEVSEEFL